MDDELKSAIPDILALSRSELYVGSHRLEIRTDTKLIISNCGQRYKPLVKVGARYG